MPILLIFKLTVCWRLYANITVQKIIFWMIYIFSFSSRNLSDSRQYNNQFISLFVAAACPSSWGSPRKDVVCYFSGMRSSATLDACLCTHLVYNSVGLNQEGNIEMSKGKHEVAHLENQWPCCLLHTCVCRLLVSENAPHDVTFINQTCVICTFSDV